MAAPTEDELEDFIKELELPSNYSKDVWCSSIVYFFRYILCNRVFSRVQDFSQSRFSFLNPWKTPTQVRT